VLAGLPGHQQRPYSPASDQWQLRLNWKWFWCGSGNLYSVQSAPLAS